MLEYASDCDFYAPRWQSFKICRVTCGSPARWVRDRGAQQRQGERDTGA